ATERAEVECISIADAQQERGTGAEPRARRDRERLAALAVEGGFLHEVRERALERVVHRRRARARLPAREDRYDQQIDVGEGRDELDGWCHTNEDSFSARVPRGTDPLASGRACRRDRRDG